MNQTDNETVTLEDMLALGVSYRQIDYWSQRGYLKPEQKKQGSGNSRTWPRSERDVVRIILKLTKVGVELAKAAECARVAVEDGATQIDLGDGLVLSLEEPA